ncbi:MAG: hypothetical protein M3N98_00915 [Actinomycetota bacterium]|nr:hypothetical protein [Actinomycetota bacterium]
MQRSMGNAAVCQILQRYTVIDPADYTLAVGSKFETQGVSKRGGAARFTQETREKAAHGVLETEQRGQGEGAWNTTKTRKPSNKALPRVQYGTNGTDAIAVEKTTGEAKVFYATPSVVVASNAKLKEVKADARLADVGGELEGPADPKNLPGPKLKLHMVKPGLERAGIITATEKFGEMSECNSFIKRVIGERSDRVAVLGRGAGHEALVDDEHEPTQPIAEFAADRPTRGAGTLAAQLEAGGVRSGTHEVALPARYTGMANKRRRDRALGINAGAAAQVGEGYVINQNEKMAGDEAGNVKLADFLAALDKKLANAAMSPDEIAMFKQKWGCHYAGIVARVGGDSVSLENYNRGTQLDWIVDDLHASQIGAVRELRDHLDALVTADAKIPAIPKLRRQWMLEQQKTLAKLGDKATDGQKAAEAALKQSNDAVKGMEIRAEDLWHFKMYGTKRGQSFHEQWSGAVNDPMTLRVRQSTSNQRQQQAVTNAIAALRAEHPCDEAEQVLLRVLAGPVAALAAATTAPNVASSYRACQDELPEAFALAMRGWALAGANAAGKKVTAVPNRPADLSKVDAYRAQLTALLHSWRRTGTVLLPASRKHNNQVNATLASLIAHIDAVGLIQV